MQPIFAPEWMENTIYCTSHTSHTHTSFKVTFWQHAVQWSSPTWSSVSTIAIFKCSSLSKAFATALTLLLSNALYAAIVYTNTTTRMQSNMGPVYGTTQRRPDTFLVTDFTLVSLRSCLTSQIHICGAQRWFTPTITQSITHNGRVHARASQVCR